MRVHTWALPDVNNTNLMITLIVLTVTKYLING